MTRRWALRLREHPRIRLVTDLEAGRSCGIGAFYAEGVESRRLAELLLERFGIFVGPPSQDAWSGPPLVRVVPNVFTSIDEIDVWVDAVEDILPAQAEAVDAAAEAPTRTRREDRVNTRENKATVQAFYAAGDAGELDKALGLLADDVTWTNIGSTDFSGTFSGKEALIADLLGPVFSRLKGGIESRVDNVVAEGDFVVVQSSGTAETVDGRPYNNSYCHVFRFEDGKIAQVTEYFDTALTQEVLGTHE